MPEGFPEDSPEDIETYRRLLDAEPKSIVEIGISHLEGSEELAWEVARKIVDKWGGIIDDNFSLWIGERKIDW
jgi:hypothetical protein